MVVMVLSLLLSQQPGPARAKTFSCGSDRERARQAAVVVVGTVHDVGQGGTGVHVDEVLKGEVALTLRFPTKLPVRVGHRYGFLLQRQGDAISLSPCGAVVAAARTRRLVPPPNVGWTTDGRLVVRDKSANEIRELSRVQVGLGIGPGDAFVGIDHKTVIATWTQAEPGCWFRIGTVPVDGSAPVALRGSGTAAVLSPNGESVAWFEASDGDCKEQALVIRKIATGAERRHPLTHTAASFITPNLRWNNNRTVVLVWYPKGKTPATVTFVAE